jgi:hypothetical protein
MKNEEVIEDEDDDDFELRNSGNKGRSLEKRFKVQIGADNCR